MCGEHRSEVIDQIKKDLAANRSIRVVSTQLVEAGVDLDFPVVYRAMAGLDSIAQAAGRCNREGRLAQGRMVVFAPPGQAPVGLLRKGEDAARSLLRTRPELARSLSPEAFKTYFEMFYSKVNTFDAQDIQRLLDGNNNGEMKFEYQFRTAAQRFRLIDEAGKPVVVWYQRGPFDSQALIEELRRFGPHRKLMRRLQRCTVNVPERTWKELQNQGDILELNGPDGQGLGLYAQAVPGLYDDVFGLRLEGPTFWGDEFIY